MERSICKNCGVPIYVSPYSKDKKIWQHSDSGSEYCEIQKAEPEKTCIKCKYNLNLYEKSPCETCKDKSNFKSVYHVKEDK